MTVPIWAWAAFAAFVVTMLAVDLFVLHRRAREVSLREAAIWSAVWVAIGLGFAGLLWAWRGGGPAQAYLAGYLIEKSLSVDNVFVFAVIFSAFAIPLRHQHRVLMLGILGALIMRAGFILAGAALLAQFPPGQLPVRRRAAVRRGQAGVRPGPHPAPSQPGRAVRSARSCPPPTGCAVSGSWSGNGAACWPPRCCWP